MILMSMTVESFLAASWKIICQMLVKVLHLFYVYGLIQKTNQCWP